MIEFKENTPTIADVYNYTYRNPKTHTRFLNEERDVLTSKIKISKRTVYKKNKEGEFTAPSERLFITTFSNPQYYPYSKIKSNGAMKQRKIRHEYEVTICIQNTLNGYDFWHSKIVWRVGSLKKWQDNVPQSKVKTIFKSTRERLERKYSKLSFKERRIAIQKECDKIRKRATFLDKSDFNSRVNGINGDWYFRVAPLALNNNCIYGRCYHKELPNIAFVFFDKHMIAILNFLLKRGIIKYK